MPRYLAARVRGVRASATFLDRRPRRLASALCLWAPRQPRGGWRAASNPIRDAGYHRECKTLLLSYSRETITPISARLDADMVYVSLPQSSRTVPRVPLQTTSTSNSRSFCPLEEVERRVTRRAGIGREDAVVRRHAASGWRGRYDEKQ